MWPSWLRWGPQTWPRFLFCYQIYFQVTSIYKCLSGHTGSQICTENYSWLSRPSWWLVVSPVRQLLCFFAPCPTCQPTGLSHPLWLTLTTMCTLKTHDPKREGVQQKKKKLNPMTFQMLRSTTTFILNCISYSTAKKNKTSFLSFFYFFSTFFFFKAKNIGQKEFPWLQQFYTFQN